MNRSIRVLIVCMLCILQPLALPGQTDTSAAVFEQEASHAAADIVRSRFTKCSRGVFSRALAEDTNSAPAYRQYRQFQWSVKSDRLTYNDVLHGVEWRGELEINAARFRSHLGYAWSPWQPLPTLSIYLQRKNGLWNFYDNTADDDPPQLGSAAPSCEEVDRLFEKDVRP